MEEVNYVERERERQREYFSVPTMFRRRYTAPDISICDGEGSSHLLLGID